MRTWTREIGTGYREEVSINEICMRETTDLGTG